MQMYCRLHQFDVYETYVDAGLSGTSMNGRRELHRMLEDCKAKRIDVIVIWRISRLSRDLVDLLEMVQTLKQHNVALHSVEDHFDSDSDYGNFTLQIMGAAAQLERDYIADNVRAGSLERSRQGYWNCGNNVLGYRWMRNSHGRGGKAEIVPEEAALVRRIFELYASGHYGIKAIATLLNKEGIKTKTGKPFNSVAVRGILHNRNYIGMIRYNVTENRRSKGKIPIEWSKGEHEPIVPYVLWEKVHAHYTNRSKAPKRTITRNFPLTGLLKCPECGKSMIPWHTRGYRKDGSFRMNYYYCCSSYNTGRPCRTNSLNADKVEELFFSQLQKLLASPEALEQIAASATAKTDTAKKPLSDRLREIESQLSQLEAQQKQVFQAFENDRLSDEKLMMSLETIKGSKYALMLEKDTLEREMSNHTVQSFPPEKVKEALQDLQLILETQEGDRQKRLLRLLVEKITVPLDRDLRGTTIFGGPALMHVKITS